MKHEIFGHLRSNRSLFMLFLYFAIIANYSFGQVGTSRQSQSHLKLEISKNLFKEGREINIIQTGLLLNGDSFQYPLIDYPNSRFLSNSNPKITLIERTSFFSRLKYTYGDGRPKNVYGYAGLSYSQDFKNTLSIYSPAFEKAKRNRLWVGLMILGAVTISATSSIESFSQRHPVSTAAILTFVTGAGIVVVASFGRTKTIQECVQIFNIR